MMEDQKDIYGIESFGISLTTLEEVFLSVAVGLGNHPSIDKDKEVMQGGSDLDEVELKNIRIQGFFKLFGIHFYALVMKRLIYFARDWKGIFCEFVIPILIMVLGMTVSLI